MQPLDDHSRNRWHMPVLLAVSAAAFATSTVGEFVWIDRVEILDAGYRVTGSEDFANLWRLTLDDYLERGSKPPSSRGGYWRPVYALSISLDWWLWGDRAWCYHVENILWHLAVVAGLYWLGLRLFAADEDGQSIAFWSALLFGVHPLCVHSVTWISGRKDTMCAAFAVAAILALARSAETRMRATRPLGASLGWLALSAVALLLALGCKELAMVVPLAALLLLPKLVPQSGPAARSARLTAGWGLAVLWSCVGLFAAYRASVLGGFGLNADYPTDSLWTNVAMSAAVMWRYVLAAVWPIWPAISDAWPIPQSTGSVEILAVVGWVAVAVIATIGYVRGRSFAFGLVWFFVFMIPAMGLVPLRHVYAERYLYPALWGLTASGTALVFAAVRRWMGQGGASRIAAWPLGAAAVLFVIATARANLFWQDEATLFAHSIAQDPRHVEARLGLAHQALVDKDYATCILQSREAIELGSDPAYKVFWSPWIAHTNLGLGLYYQGKPVEAQAEFEQALARRPDHARSHYHVGLAAFAAGDLRSAARHYHAALELDPNDFLCRSNLAVTVLQLGDAAQCVDLLAPLIESHPDEPVNLNNYASALLALERHDKALPHFAHLIELEPDQPLHRAKLAWCLWETGRKDAAQRELARVRAEIPDHPTVRFLTGLFAQGGR